MQQRVVVLGGTGFVGRALAQRLVDDGIEVCVVARSAFPEAESLGVRFLSGDIDFLKNCLAGHDTVFHLASKTGICGDKNDYYTTTPLAPKTSWMPAAHLPHPVISYHEVARRA